MHSFRPMSKFCTIGLIGCSALFGACSTKPPNLVAPPEVRLLLGAAGVRVVKSDPPNGYAEIGPISVTDGTGCGGFGYTGTYERAVVLLKNKAYLLGADFVQIFVIKEPTLVELCLDNEYSLRGTAYRAQ